MADPFASIVPFGLFVAPSFLEPRIEEAGSPGSGVAPKASAIHRIDGSDYVKIVNDFKD